MDLSFQTYLLSGRKLYVTISVFVLQIERNAALYVDVRELKW